MAELTIYLTLGAAAGLLAGLFGVGGGLIIVPVLAWTFAAQEMDPGVIMHLAIGTSLASIWLTSIMSIRAHQKRGAVNWALVKQLVAGIVLGAFAGALIAEQLPTHSLKRIFGVFELLVAAQMLFVSRYQAHFELPGKAGMTAAGGVIGGVSAIIGIGGGTLTVPFLIWCRVPMLNAVATSGNSDQFVVPSLRAKRSNLPRRQIKSLEIIRYAHPFGAALRAFCARKLAGAASLRSSQ
jgi:uncharacterized protein